MVSFDAKSSNERSFFVSPSGDGDNGWEKYGVYEASVGPEVANYNFVFEMTSTTDPTARLEFNLGNNIGTLWIGNVSVTELKAEDGIDHDMKKSPLADGNRIYNGTFDQGTQRVAFWHLENMEAAIPDVIVKEDGSEDYSRKAQLSAVLADAKMYQNGIQVNGGADYTISLDLAGDKAAEVTIKLTGSDGNIYAENTFAYDGSGVQNFEYTYTAAEGIMDNEAVFTLSIPEGTSVEVDNVRMCMVKE